MKEELRQKIVRHGEELNKYFGIRADPIRLSKALRRIEGYAHRAAERFANGEIDGEEWEKISALALKKIKKLLGTTSRIFINGDPRGYALKIQIPNSFYNQDWGGYGILAPDLRE